MKTLISVEKLRSLLHYDPLTGIFTWKVSKRGCGGAVQVGKVAGNIDTKGRRQICIDGTHYFAHRLAFPWMTGRWPIDQVDHANRDFTDNKWANLRNATNSLNAVNRRTTRYKNHGLPRGVHRLPSGRFSAAIQEHGRLSHIGVFDTTEAAEAAYKKRAVAAFGEFFAA